MSLGNLGVNTFSYCLNNPTNWADPSGCKPGDYFQSVDEAARDAAIYIGWISFLLGWEYATSIYAVTVTTYRPYRRVSYSYGSDGTVRTSVRIEYIATTHTVYTYSSIWTDKNAVEVVPPLAPHGYELEAFVHTHPLGSGQGITRISDGDKSLAKMYGIPIYAYGPNGQLRAYDPESGEDILIYDDLPEALIKHWKYYKGGW